MFKVIKKWDIFLLITLLVFVAATAFVSSGFSGKGEKVIVNVNGHLYGEYSLKQNRQVTIKNGNHENKITIKNGFVQMTHANCKNQVCVREGRISKANQTIVCLPNRVFIQIKGGEAKYDSVTR